MPTRSASLSVAGLALLVGLFGPPVATAKPGTPAKAPAECRAELGPTRASQLVRDCLESRPATPAICRPETPCRAMREMIELACQTPGAEARPVCDEDADEDDDE